MEKLEQQHPETFKEVSHETMENMIVSKTYEFPKKLVSIRKPVDMTEEQKQILH